jgi:hypothetical protein
LEIREAGRGFWWEELEGEVVGGWGKGGEKGGESVVVHGCIFVVFCYDVKSFRRLSRGIGGML